MTEPLLRIGELATRAEVTSRTIDYYTTMGLLAPARRSAGNYRLYEASDVERIHLIQRLEAQGIPLEEITTAFTNGPGDVSELLARIDCDLKNLHAVAEAASSEIHGLISIIAARVHSLIAVAIQIPPDIPIL